MPPEGPLDQPRLRAIELQIDAGELDAAQRQLSELGDDPRFGPAISYLATKMLLRRGRLAAPQVAERLRDLLRVHPQFPEASLLLARIESHAADPTEVGPPSQPDPREIDGAWDDPGPTAAAPKPADSLPIPQLPDEVPTEPPPPRRTPTARPVPRVATPVQDFRAAQAAARASRRSDAPDIPPAPGVPRFSPPPDASPSYAPAAASASEHDRPTITPEQLSGRYSGAPPHPEEVVRSGRPRPAKPTRVRSAPPPPLADRRASTSFEIAQLLDQGKLEAVLEAVGPDRQEAEPDFVLMKARAQMGLGRRKDALATLRRFCAAPLLEPDLRSGGSRLLVELGDYETAFVQSSRAFAEAPETPPVRLAHAWAALRLARRRDTTALTHTAEAAVAGLKSREGPYPALVLALRACVQAHLGDGKRAIHLAQRALTLEPRSVDAEVALALGSAEIGLGHDARQAYLRLRRLAPDEANAIARQLEQLGVAVPSLSMHGAFDLATRMAAEIWDPMEMLVLDGKHEQAVRAFEHVCRQRLSELARSAGDQSFSAIAQLAVRVLTTAPVWQHFAPYDLSLWSVARVNAALDVLYGPGRHPREDGDEFPVLVLLGSYLGEVLCVTHEARWEGAIAELDQARVVAGATRFTPFRSLLGCLHEPAPLELALPRSVRSAHPGADPWSRAIAPSATPPCPWDPDPWPAAAALPKLGRALAHSVVARHCEERGGGPLDVSLASLAALDNYVSLVAPSAPRRDPSSPWIPRLVVLVGAYLGETLCETGGGAWVEPPAEPTGPDAYRLKVGDREVLPVAQAHQRIIGQSPTPLREYAAQVLRKT